jgi:hypothetical protein
MRDGEKTFFKRFIAQKIQRDTQGYKIVPLTNLPQLSFAEASDRVSTVLGMYIQCSSEKQYKGKTLRQLGEWLKKVLGPCVYVFLILAMEVS